MTTIEKVIYALNNIPNQKGVGPNGESTYNLVKELEEFNNRKFKYSKYQLKENGRWFPIAAVQPSHVLLSVIIRNFTGFAPINWEDITEAEYYKLKHEEYLELELNAQETDKEDLKKKKTTVRETHYKNGKPFDVYVTYSKDKEFISAHD